jgi:hypothetical protein
MALSPYCSSPVYNPTALIHFPIKRFLSNRYLSGLLHAKKLAITRISLICQVKFGGFSACQLIFCRVCYDAEMIMLQDAVQFAMFQCSFLSTVYVSTIHISRVSMFQ